MTSCDVSWFAQPSLSIQVIALCFFGIKWCTWQYWSYSKENNNFKDDNGRLSTTTVLLVFHHFVNHSTFLQNILCYSCQFWKPEVVQICCHQREKSLAPSIVSSFLFEQLSIYIFVDTGSFRHTFSAGRKSFLFRANVSSERPFHWNYHLGGGGVL